MRTTQLILTACLFSTTTLAGVSDFYVAGADSRIYSVDGETLQATEIFQINGNGQIGINEILFTGGDTMLANITGQLVQYDMVTGVQTTIMTLSDHYDSGIQQASGLVRTLDDRLGFSVFEYVNPSGTDRAFAAYDPFTGEYEELSGYATDDVGYLDVYQVSSTIMLGLNWSSSHVTVTDITDGSQVDRFELDFDPASFLEVDDQLFILDDSSDLFTFDTLTGETEFYGSIQGVGGATIGATSGVAFRIPAPGVPMVLAMGGLVAARRRRD